MSPALLQPRPALVLVLVAEVAVPDPSHSGPELRQQRGRLVIADHGDALDVVAVLANEVEALS